MKQSKLFYSMLTVLILLLISICVLLLVYLLPPMCLKKKGKQNQATTGQVGLTPMDEKGIVQRFSTLRDLWYLVASDRSFVQFANNLGDVNAEALFSNVGSVEILKAYNELDNYIRGMGLDKDTRITLIYPDGIVFYDSALPIGRIFFMQNGLPKPVSMATLGSPLKNHNVVPEMTNAVTVHSIKNPLYLLGYPLTNPLYQDLVKEGFGFFERISSSLNVPYSYMAKFLPIPSGNGPTTFFLDGIFLRISLPIEDNFFQQIK